jgi:hypothetical protein
MENKLNKFKFLYTLLSSESACFGPTLEQQNFADLTSDYFQHITLPRFWPSYPIFSGVLDPVPILNPKI